MAGGLRSEAGSGDEDGGVGGGSLPAAIAKIRSKRATAAGIPPLRMMAPGLWYARWGAAAGACRLTKCRFRP